MSLADTPAEAPKKKSLLGRALGGAKTVWAAAIVSALVVAALVLNLLGTALARESYWVLGTNVAARTQITPDMLVEISTTKGGKPVNAIDLAEVNDNEYFALAPLRAGDVLSPSNVGPLTRIDSDLPDNFVVASFQVAPENAVAGKVRKGDYIDLIATNGDDAGATAKVVLHHVLVLDVTVAPETIADAATSGAEGSDINPGPESAAVRGGIPSLYTVGVTPADATRLALVRDKNIMVTLSANNTTGKVDAQTQLGNVFGAEPVGDSGAGTEKAAAKAKTEDGQAASADTGTEKTEKAPTGTETGEPTGTETGAPTGN